VWWWWVNAGPPVAGRRLRRHDPNSRRLNSGSCPASGVQFIRSQMSVVSPDFQMSVVSPDFRPGFPDLPLA
jgi:hypothetical protein